MLFWDIFPSKQFSDFELQLENDEQMQVASTFMSNLCENIFINIVLDEAMKNFKDELWNVESCSI